MNSAFLELSTVLVLAAGLGIVAKIFKQPLVIAYILAGVVIASLGYFKSYDRVFFETLSSIGIAFLLFLVGIDLKLSDIKYVGRAAFLTGFGQMAFIGVVGFFIVVGLGYSLVPAIYIAFALTFSSTVIIVKLLSEKNDLRSLYGKIAVGFLLIQDFVAILALMFLSGFGPGRIPTAGGIFLILFKGLLLVIFTYLVARYLLRFIFKQASVSVELLFVAAIAWAFLLSAIAESAGFSIAIGAFLAGIAIAQSPYSLQISARVKPLRDFFLIIFFILLGTSLSSGTFNFNLIHLVLISLFILIGNPLIVIAVMLSLGFRNRTSFMSSIAVAQISEFSLILMTVGRS